MSKLIHAANANEAWIQARDLLFTSSEAVAAETRGGTTTELLHVSITIKDPRQRWVFARQPAINPAFALAEAVWILAGRNDSEVLNFFNRDLAKYAGEGPTFYGAYGYRLRHQQGTDQLEAAYRALSSNSATRQVVLQIWDAHTDLPGGEGQPRSPDVPCNTQSMLRVQNGKLHWLQTMRSNDLFRGMPYNFVQFTTLHEVVAGWLGLELGDYTHTVNCLHFYHKDKAALDQTKDIMCAPNTDTLMYAKSVNDAHFKFLDELISKVTESPEGAARFADRLDMSRYPAAHGNIANLILAEAARRHGDFKLASRRLSLVTNPSLRELGKNWFERFTERSAVS